MTTKGTTPTDPIDREFAEAWIPDPGDVLKKFEVLYVSERPDAFNDDKFVPIVTGRVGSGSTEGGSPLEEGTERAFHAIHTGARNKLADLKVKPGDVIAVKFLGWHAKGTRAEELGPKQKPKSAKARDGSFRYRVIRYGDEGKGIDWSHYTEESDEDEPGSDIPADMSAPLEESAQDNGDTDDDDVVADGDAGGVDDDMPF